MYANTVNLSTGVVTTLTLPADVGSVLVHSPDNPVLLTYNVPNIHGNTFVAQQNVTDGDVLECINGILKINLLASGNITAVVAATRK